MAEYLRFMQLKIASPMYRYAPSDKIDALWHAHILSTVQYQIFCERHNGGSFIHHDPSMGDMKNRYVSILHPVVARFALLLRHWFSRAQYVSNASSLLIPRLII